MFLYVSNSKFLEQKYKIFVYELSLDKSITKKGGRIKRWRARFWHTIFVLKIVEVVRDIRQRFAERGFVPMEVEVESRQALELGE